MAKCLDGLEVRSFASVPKVAGSILHDYNTFLLSISEVLDFLEAK